jgi:hypothetical protein
MIKAFNAAGTDKSGRIDVDTSQWREDWCELFVSEARHGREGTTHTHVILNLDRDAAAMIVALLTPFAEGGTV